MHGLADGIFWSGVFAFVSASINAIKTGVRSIKNAKIEGSSQSGSQPCCKIHGKAHGSAKHQAKIMEEVERMVNSGKYSDIYLNRSLHTTGMQSGNYLRPDIIGVKNGGGFTIIEVASKSQASGRALKTLINHINIYKDIVGSANVKFIPWGY